MNGDRLAAPLHIRDGAQNGGLLRSDCCKMWNRNVTFFCLNLEEVVSISFMLSHLARIHMQLVSVTLTVCTKFQTRSVVRPCCPAECLWHVAWEFPSCDIRNISATVGLIGCGKKIGQFHARRSHSC